MPALNGITGNQRESARKAAAEFFPPASCLLTLTAWLVLVPSWGRADEVPEKYRETVRKGLEYLVKNQHKDGHWEGDDGKHPVAMTALAGMALVMEGSNFREGPYSANIRKAADWLLDRSRKSGLIFSDHSSETDRYMYGHGLATLFLISVYRPEKDHDRRAKLKDVIARGVDYIGKAQSSQGGWYLTSRAEGHDFDEVAATAIQVQALQAAHEIGVAGNRFDSATALSDAHEYLKTALAQHEKEPKPGPKRSRAAETTAALSCRFRYLIISQVEDEHYKNWFKYGRTEIRLGSGLQHGRDEFTHYHYALAVYNNYHSEATQNATIRPVTREAVTWSDYRTAMFDRLQSSQKKDGSWPAPLTSQGDIGAGAVYATAVWCTILQLDNNSHPLTRPRV